MTPRRALLLSSAAVLGLSVAVAPSIAAPPSLPLTLVADVPLPGGATRFDYQWVDADRRRLYVAHLGDGALLVFDLDAQRVLQEVPNLPGVHGVVAAPSEHVVLATATGEKTLALVDDRTFQVKARVPAGEYPNGLAFDPTSGKAFVSNNTGRGIGVVDVKTATALPAIDIGGGAGNTQYDAATGHVLAAVHGSPVLIEINPQTDQIAERIARRGVTSCHGLVVASASRLAFAACRGAAPTLVIVDLKSRRQLSALPLPAGIDVLAFDPVLGNLYAASESGTVAVYRVSPDAAVAEVARAFLAPNAHSVAVDPTTHRVYFPLQSVNGKPVLRVMAPQGS